MMSQPNEISPEVIRALANIVAGVPPTDRTPKLRRVWYQSTNLERAMLISETLIAGRLIERSGLPKTEAEGRALYEELMEGVKRLVIEIEKEIHKIAEARPEAVMFEDMPKTLQ